MSKSLVLVANAAQACLYHGQLSVIGGAIKILEKFEHPANRQKESELVSDKSGNFSNIAHGTMEHTNQAKSTENERFAKQVIDALVAQHKNNHNCAILRQNIKTSYFA